MNCLYCASPTTKEQTKKMSLGYRTFWCSTCQRTFNERTGTPFNFLEYPTDFVLLVVLWRLRYKLSLRDLAEMFLERGFEFTHEAVRAIRETLGSEVTHRCNRYLNNRLEQDHRGIKQRYYPMRGFGSVASAARFCRAFDEVRQFFRIRTTMKQKVSLAQQREVFRHRLEALKAMGLVASHPEGWWTRSAQYTLVLPAFSVLTHPSVQVSPHHGGGSNLTRKCYERLVCNMRDSTK